MKNVFGGALRCNRQSFAIHQTLNGVIRNTSLFSCSVILIAFLFTACKKQAINEPVPEIQGASAQSAEATVLSMYEGLSWQTMWELQQARAASAKYRNFDHAIKDGYADINVVVPEMGYHFLKAAHLDGNFDYRKPEILVYNKNEDGNMQLVAVEYAIPIDLSPNVAPAGFTGNHDVWDRNTGFGLWLLHAWVWSYNPAGVFNPTNPLVHLH